MPFTAQELANISNAAIDFHMNRGEVHSQTIQARPLLKKLLAKKKTFPGGKDNITVRVKGNYTTTGMGYSHDDTVTYKNPANIKQAVFPWRETHAGIQVTMTELKKDGISVVDSESWDRTTEHSQREQTALANLLEDKLEDMSEGWARFKNDWMWRDGTQDPKVPPGLMSFILDNPLAAINVGGIDQVANAWWQNRAKIAVAANSGNAASQVLVQTLQREARQLRRYNQNRLPDIFLAGSDFLDQFEQELRSKGTYTLDGWAKNGGSIDASVADLAFKGIILEYDPTLDDMGRSKYGYWFDSKAIHPRVMEGEDDKAHAPSRPEDKYVLYRAITWTGGLVCRQRNCNCVCSIA